MIPAFVVMLMSAVACAVSFVPNVCQCLHGLWLFLVESLEEVPADRPAIASEAVLVKPHGGNQQAFVACHDVGKIPQGLCRVVSFADVNVYSAHVAGIAFGSGVAKVAKKFLQGGNVFVVQDGRYQFGLFVAGFCIDADIPLEFPFPALSVPCAPSVVTVAVCRVLVASGAEVVGGNFGCLLAADAVHLNLHPNGLFLHVLNLLGGIRIHLEIPFLPCGLLCFSLLYISL